RIDLLPIKALQAEVTRRREIIIGSVGLGRVVSGLAGFLFYYCSALSQLEKELAGLRTEIQALNVKVKQVGDLQNKIKDLKGKHKIIDDLNQNKSRPVRVMESPSVAPPPSLWLTELRESGGSLTMNGVAVDNQTVADFMKALAA